MKRKLGFLMTLVIALCTSSAWAQSVVSVGTNLDFSEGTPVDNGICTYAKDMESNGTTYSQMLEVTGWTIEGKNGDDRAAGLFAYGSGHWLGSVANIAPATNPAGVAEGNALGIVAVWSATAQYVQPVTLEAGNYVISVPVYNSVGGTTAPVKSLIGFIAGNGTEYLAPAKAYAVDAWTVETVTFTLAEATTGKLSLGYTAPSKGSVDNVHLFFDKVEILYTDLSADDVRGALDAALVTAQATVDAKAGVGAGLFMYSEETYNTYAAAVAAAKAVSENAEATKDDLMAALAALNAATEAYVVTAPAADAVYAMQLNGTENYLTIGESAITIESAADALSFEAAGNGKYYIHDNVGKYLSYAGNNKWTMTASADVKDEWTVSVKAEGLYTLTGKNGGIGVDGTEAGATCYGDKSGASVALWTIAEIVIEEEPVVPEESKTDYTDAIVNADLSTTDAWNTEGTKGISGGMVKVGSQAVYDFSQTITLPAGQYKMTAKAVYRYGSDEQAEYDAIQAGTDTHKAKLYAETATKKYEANVQNRNDGASDTDYAGEGTVTINGKYVPNSSAAVQAWFNAGQYVNELVFNVYEDGQVKIGITTVDGIAGDYGNIGAWTLTRLGDAVAEPIEPEAPYFADGDYLIINTETGCYLGGGNDWGTHATLLAKPQFFTFAHQGNNAYTLDSHQSNGGNSHFLGTNLYCDAAAANWTFAKTENGNYTINNGGNYLAGNGANNVIVTVTEVTTAAEWTIISRAEAIAALDAATVEAPVDATIYIANPECKRNAGGWTVTSADGTGTPANHAMGSGGNTANCSESYRSSNGFDMSQVLVGMKPGTYRLDAHAFYRNYGNDTDTIPYIYVNDQQSLFPELTGSEGSMAAAYALFLAGDYAIEPIYFTVAEGDEVKIGAHGDNTAFWNIWGEFGLKYYGDATMEDIMLVVPRQEFVARYFAMEAFSQEELNYAWNSINGNYFWPVMDAAMAIKDTIDKVTDMALLDSMMTEMDNAEAMVLKAYVLADEYNKVKNLFWDASDNSTAISDEARMAMETALENSNFANYTIATIEDLEAAIVELKADYIDYVGNATPVEGFLFDVTCVFANPSFEAGNINGWTATEGWQFQNNRVYTGEGTELNNFQERWVSGTGLGNTSTMQTLANMPNGTYRISADIMATAQYNADPKGHTTGAYWVANTDSVAVATANNIPERFTVETTVVDGNLTIGLVGVNTTANWMGLDNVTIEYCGVAPVVVPAGKKVVYNLDVEREAGLGYTAKDYTIEASELAALLGVESLGEATIWGVNPDGSYVADAMNVYDGWRAVDGTFAGWSSETAAVCVKLFAEEAAYLISICTHADNGNDPVAGTKSTAVWALVAGVDTVVINTNITFTEPAIVNIADFEVVSTIKVEHNETAGVAFSENTASFDAAAVAAALGVASIDEAEQYILNVTTGNLVTNSTDGWRNSQGDATAWGSLDEGSVCVKINDPASGTIDYIGCYDTTYEAGETYTAKWAFVHEGKAVVIEVVITFISEQGISNIETTEDAVIYTITGKRVQGNVKSLDSGIYIVNGRKVLVK